MKNNVIKYKYIGKEYISGIQYNVYEDTETGEIIYRNNFDE